MPSEFEREMLELTQDVLREEPPPGTIRKVDSPDNMIVRWPSGNMTIVGSDAWRLYACLQTFRFADGSVCNMRHLLEHAEPCDDVRPLLEQPLRAEAALMNTEVGWPQFTTGPVALRLSSEMPGFEEPVLANREGRYSYLLNAPRKD